MMKLEFAPPTVALIISLGALSPSAADGRHITRRVRRRQGGPTSTDSSESVMGCTVPTGIDEGSAPSSPLSVSYDDAYPNLPADDSIFGRAIGPALSVSPGLNDYETPIQVRATMSSLAGIYGVASAFHPAALEMFGRVHVSEQRRRCQPGDGISQDLFDKQRRVTLAYVTVWQLSESIPQIRDALGDLGAGWGLDVETCRPLQSEGRPECEDLSTPWGLARSIVEENAAIFVGDGWNADGSYSSTYNRIPFRDWRPEPYSPATTAADCPEGDGTCWQLLLEHDSLGFLYRQEHVVPHIGQTARSIFLGDSEVCSREVSPPNYNYDVEAEKVLSRTNSLDDSKKAEVEFFDSKLDSLLPLQVQYYAKTGVPTDSFAFIRDDAAAIAALYESVVVAWKEKVRHDLVRPTTWIHENFGDRTVESYLGPEAGGSGWLPADEWQPYKRVMPHAEYPSGSSCMCKAFTEVMERASGNDSLLDTLGGPLEIEAKANSSKIESDSPAEDIVFEYFSWSEIAQKCGESRLNGGMHFTDSVPAGVDLCTNIGYMVWEYFANLEAGDVPDFTADVENMVTEEVRCPA